MPSLLGEWRSTGNLDLTKADGSSFGAHQCPSFWTVTSQDGGDFSGSVDITGNGRNSDRLCGYGGSFRGRITADGAVTLRIDPLLTQGCSRVTGDGTFTGTARPDGSIVIETREAVTCKDYDDQQQEGTRTVAFSWRRPRP